MRGFVWILLLASFGLVRNVVRHDCACGESKNVNSRRIVNGKEASPNKYPWMAVMLSSGGKQVCSGSILSDKMIVTAGHCLFYASKPLTTSWGVALHSVSHLKTIRGNIYATTRYELHPKFKAGKYFDNYDLCLVTVDRRIQFNKNTVPICLPQAFEHTKYFNQQVIVAGWGTTREGKDSPVSDLLLETRIVLKTPETCKKMTRLSNYDTRAMICAYGHKTDACLGDSGGPIFIEAMPNHFIILGVISFGEGCARYFPGIYARLDEPETLHWLKRSLAGDVCHDPKAILFKNPKNKHHFI